MNEKKITKNNLRNAPLLPTFVHSSSIIFHRVTRVNTFIPRFFEQGARSTWQGAISREQGALRM